MSLLKMRIQDGVAVPLVQPRGSSMEGSTVLASQSLSSFLLRQLLFLIWEGGEVGSSSRARNESASSNKSKLTVPERARLEKHCGIMKFWSRLKCDGFLPHEGIEVTTGAITGATLAQDLELRD
ncbi:hypothetical protein Tco_1201729 [Tanacetum coccineum]